MSLSNDVTLLLPARWEPGVNALLVDTFFSLFQVSRCQAFIDTVAFIPFVMPEVFNGTDLPPANSDGETKILETLRKAVGFEKITDNKGMSLRLVRLRQDQLYGLPRIPFYTAMKTSGVMAVRKFFHVDSPIGLLMELNLGIDTGGATSLLWH